MFCWGGYFSHGTAGEAQKSDKVLHYCGVYVQANCLNAWIRNDLLTIYTDANPNYVNGYELDLNNLRKNYGATNAGAGLAAPSVYGMTFNGANPQNYTITGAYCIISSSANQLPVVERGYVIGPNAVRQASVDDYSAAAASYRDTGSHQVGIDLSGSYSTAGVRIPRGATYAGLNTGGATMRFMTVDTVNELRLGDPSYTSNIVSERTILPAADNAWQFGATSLRWQSIWAVNGTIQTSDSSLKTDIAEIDAEQASMFVDALTPRSYRWIVGGRVPVYEARTETVLVRNEVTTVEIKGIVHEVSVPVYEDQVVQALVGFEDVPGTRRHFGFIGSEVKEAFEAAGMDDFGGYVRGDDGLDAIRPDQLLAIAFAEIKSLKRRIANLEEAAR